MTKSVGKSFARFDAADKVSGRAKYVDDISYPGMWYGTVVRASIPRGRVKSVQFNKSFDWSKVIVADWHDIPGKNIVAQIKDDQQFLVKDVVNHVGEAILVVAAPTRELAKEAARHVSVEYEKLPAVLMIEEARSRKKNIICNYNVNNGDPDSTFANAEFVIEGEYRTGFHEHAYIEPQGVIALPRGDGGFTIEGSLQCPYYVLKAICQLLDLPQEKVNVRQTVIGGAFGGKEDYPSLLAGYAVLLAKKCGHPVKIVYDRHEDILVTTKRHPSIVRHKTAVAKDGTLLAMDISVEFDGGAYATLSPVVLARGLLHSWGPYRCENVCAKAICWATNNVPTGAFRGFGAPQTLFAIESHMDVIAAKLGISPLEIRRKNCLRVGDKTPTGQVLKESVGALECLEKAAAAAEFEKKWHAIACHSEAEGRRISSGQLNSGDPSPPAQDDRMRRGIGLSLFMHGAGFTGSGEALMKGKAGIRLEKDGRVTILTGCTDMGQGAHTVLPQIVAEALGMPLKMVSCAVPDTAVVPDSGPTVASRTTMVIGKVLMKCCEELKKRVIARSETTKQSPAGDCHVHQRRTRNDSMPLIIEKHYKLPPDIKWDQEKFLGDAYPAYAWGCNVAEVEVDMDTFEPHVTKMWMACDVGKAINPQAVEGQIEGGTLQALGYGIMEEMRYINGEPLNNKFQTYIIPTAKDAPEFETIIVENPFSWGPYGAKGLGELPLDGGAPAIANAIYNATGVRVADLPITAEKIFNILRAERSGVEKQFD